MIALLILAKMQSYYGFRLNRRLHDMCLIILLLGMNGYDSPLRERRILVESLDARYQEQYVRLGENAPCALLLVDYICNMASMGGC